MFGIVDPAPTGLNPANTLSAFRATTSTFSFDIRPAIASSTMPITRPSLTTTCPPPLRRKLFAAMAMSGIIRAHHDQMMAIVRNGRGDGAPRLRPNPLTRPSVIPFIPLCRRTTATLARSASMSAAIIAVRRRDLDPQMPRRRLILDDADHVGQGWAVSVVFRAQSPGA